MYAHRFVMTTVMCMVATLSAPFTYGQLRDEGSTTISGTSAEGQASADANPKARAIPEASLDVTIPDRDARRAVDPEDDPVDQRRQRQFEELERQISREPIDEEWATKERGQLREAFDRVLRESEPSQPAPALISLLCRTSLCRLEIAHALEDDTATFLSDLPARIGWSGSVLLDRPTGQTTVLYLTRSKQESRSAK